MVWWEWLVIFLMVLGFAFVACFLFAVKVWIYKRAFRKKNRKEVRKFV